MNPIMTEGTDEVGLVSDPGEEVAPACVCVSCAKSICEQTKCPDCDSHVVMHEQYIALPRYVVATADISRCDLPELPENGYGATELTPAAASGPTDHGTLR